MPGARLHAFEHCSTRRSIWHDAAAAYSIAGNVLCGEGQINPSVFRQSLVSPGFAVDQELAIVVATAHVQKEIPAAWQEQAIVESRAIKRPFDPLTPRECQVRSVSQ